MGNAYLASGRPSQALQWLKQALKLHADTSAIYFALSQAYKAVEDYPKAMTTAKKAAELSKPDDPLAENIERLLSELEQASPG